MRIAISGHSGCGNTTATTNVGRELDLRVVNYTFRDLARDLEMDFDELHRDSTNNAVYDYLTDLTLIKAAQEDAVVVGSRLAAWLINADLRIWLDASLEVRAKRINLRESEKHSSYEAVLYKTLKRDEQNQKRYLMLYGIDIEDREGFDIIINTQTLKVEQVSGLIVAAAKWASVNHIDRTNLHLPRICSIISEKLRIPISSIMDPQQRIDVRAAYARVSRA